MNNNDIDKPLYAIEDDEKPLYEIEDSLSPRPEEEYCIDDMDEEQPTEESVVSEKKNPSPVRLLFKTMFTPVEGWKALKRARLKTEEFASRCFYPLIALAAISEVTKIFYEANVSVSDWAVDGLITFMTFFFGYFSVLLAGGFMLPSKSRDIIKKDIGKQFVMLAMSSLAIFWIFIQIMPMLIIGIPVLWNWVLTDILLKFAL